MMMSDNFKSSGLMFTPVLFILALFISYAFLPVKMSCFFCKSYGKND